MRYMIDAVEFADGLQKLADEHLADSENGSGEKLEAYHLGASHALLAVVAGLRAGEPVDEAADQG